MNKIVLLILILGISINVMAQNQPELVIAKYKNGIHYVGEKIEEEGNMVTLRINTMDTIHIDRNLLSRYHDSKTALIFPNGKYIQTQGGFWDLTFGFNSLAIFDTLDQRVSSHLAVIYGKRINDRFNIGVGFGFEFNEAKVAGFQFDTQFASVFAYGRYYLNNSSKRLFVFSRIGVGYPSEETENEITAEHSSGINTLSGLGIHWASRNRSTFHINLGFYTQKTHGIEFFLDPIGSEIETKFDILIKRLMFNFGWEFG